MREKHHVQEWHKGIWFKHYTPKYSFLTWLAVKDRLSTGSRMLHWNVSVDISCVFCKEPLETIEHLFFECPYSKQIWESMAKGVLREKYTERWEEILRLIVSSNHNKLQLFTTRYMLQSAVHSIWCERNRRRHGEKESPPTLLTSMLDKIIRNKFSIIQRRKDNKLEGGLRYWFDTR